uniref:Reverse transcriptase Ty1/copia-type domain-containing protein n=1 Tax=Fagus sylvatica TaxID=28930 RepID=A0A2N9EF74_FAGSY
MSDFDVLGIRRKACATFFCKVLDLWETELRTERYGPANRGRQSVSSPSEGIFPAKILARPGKALTIREFHTVHERVLLSNMPGLADQLVVQALHRGELGFARYDLANRGRWNVPYAKGSFSDRDSGLTGGALDDPEVARYLVKFREMCPEPPSWGYSDVAGTRRAKYAYDLLSKAGLTDSKTVSTLLELNVKLNTTDGESFSDATLYRQLMGSLIYLTLTRPDLAYVVYLHSLPLSCAPMLMQTGLEIPLIVALPQLRWLLTDMGAPQTTNTPIHCDNRSAIHIAHNDVFHERTKHIEIDCHFIRHHLQQSALHLLSVSSEGPAC